MRQRDEERDRDRERDRKREEKYETERYTDRLIDMDKERERERKRESPTLARASSPCCHMKYAILCLRISTAHTISSWNGYLNASCIGTVSIGNGTSSTMLLI